MKRYMKAKKTIHRKQNNETNDCSVIAVSIVARTTYKAAHVACQASGRTNRRGLCQQGIVHAIRSLGLTVERMQDVRQKNGSKFTPKTIGNKLKRGYYICFVNNHVFAMVNGDVEDWTQGRKHHITDVYKVVRKRT